MPISRRKSLALIGGGTVLAATAGSTLFLSTRAPTGATEPWTQAGNYKDPRMNALSWALLAPNPHNRQPWRAELRGTDELILWRNAAAGLPETDPFDRQLTIGMGCFVDLMVMAAEQDGYVVDLTLFPDGDKGPVALARFEAGEVPPNPLFAAVPFRRTNRKAYDDQPIAQAALGEVSAHGTIVTEPEMVTRLRSLTIEAWEIEARSSRVMQETVDVTRIGRRQIEANPDGIALSGPLNETLGLFGLLRAEDMLDQDSMGFRQMMSMFRKAMSATPAYAVVTTAGNTRTDQIEAGRRWLRLQLAGTSVGLSMQPVSQALQEYPEMADHYAHVHELLAGPGETVQMLARLGYGPDVEPSPRWPLEAFLKNG